MEIISRPLKSILPFFVRTLSYISQPPGSQSSHMTVFFPMECERKGRMYATLSLGLKIVDVLHLCHRPLSARDGSLTTQL